MMWMISWTPYAFVALLGISGNQRRLTPGLTMIPALFAKMSACVNPIIYTLTHPKIKKEILRRWHCFISSRTLNGNNVFSGGDVSEFRQDPSWHQNSISNAVSVSPIAHNFDLTNSLVNNKNATESYIQPTESVLMQDRLNVGNNTSLQERSQNCIENTSKDINSRLEYDETCL